MEGGEQGIDFLVERDKTGRFIMKNFESVKSLGLFQFAPVRQVRPVLGDRDNLAVLNLVASSIYVRSPRFIRNSYRLGKLIGYFSAQEAFSTFDLLAPLVRKSGILWSLIESGSVQDHLVKGWLESGGGVLGFGEIDKDGKRMVFTLQESVSSAIKSKSKLCHFEVAILCGQLEYLLGGVWDGIETGCAARGDPSCVFELYENLGGEHPPLANIPSEEAKSVLDQYLKIAISEEKGFGRPHVKDLGHISLTQTFNYLVLSRSAGHGIMMRYSGKEVGKMIAAQAGIKDLACCIEYLKALFKDLRIGLAEVAYEPDELTVRLEESVFSAGVKDIGMKLCCFPAGLMEGCLESATGLPWRVEEKECVGEGFPACVFSCATHDASELKRLLLG